MSKNKFTYAQKLCVKKAGLALQSTNSLWPDCRIGVALSGGEDSFTLLKVLKIRQAIVPFPFEIMAIHLNPGFNNEDHLKLSAWLREEGIASHIEINSFGIMAHSQENQKKTPCFICAWNRRKRLFELCNKYNLTHLALGHNADDLVDTFMLNIFRNGRVSALPFKESFFKGKILMIRPLLMVDKKYLHQAAKQWQLPIWKNSCPTSGKSSRSQMRFLLKQINDQIPEAKNSITSALVRWQHNQEKTTISI